MKIYYKQDKSNHQYYLSNAMLKCVDSYKHLGVIMSRDLSWSNHVDASVHKANKVLGLLRRTICSKNREIFSLLYRSLVRPLLEYPSLRWSPYLVKDKLAIESIQRRASRIALGQKRRETNLVPRAHVCFGQRQDTVLWNNPFQESKILGLPVSRRMRGLV